jgi:hypothetical protein
MTTDPRLARPLWRGRSNVDAFTIAWVEHAEAIVRDRWPAIAHQLQVIKGGYQPAADPDSADTHTRGGATDFVWCHPQCLLALRLAGGFAWHRTPAQGDWADHIHGAPIGHPDMAPGLARQEISYLGRRNGLQNNGPDDGPRLDPIPRPTWPWPQEDIVTPDDIKKIATETTKQLLATKVAAEGPTVKAALRMASKASGLEDRVAARVGQLLLNEPGDIAATVTADQIEAAVKQALREGTGD